MYILVSRYGRSGSGLDLDPPLAYGAPQRQASFGGPGVGGSAGMGVGGLSNEEVEMQLMQVSCLPSCWKPACITASLGCTWCCAFFAQGPRLAFMTRGASKHELLVGWHALCDSLLPRVRLTAEPGPAMAAQLIGIFVLT